MRASGVRSQGRSPVSSWIPSGARSSSEMTFVTPICWSVVQNGTGVGGKYSAKSTGRTTIADPIRGREKGRRGPARSDRGSGRRCRRPHRGGRLGDRADEPGERRRVDGARERQEHLVVGDPAGRLGRGGHDGGDDLV